MNRIIVIIMVGFLSSCTSNYNKKRVVETKTIYDTIRIVEKVIDTIVVENRINTGSIELYIQEKLYEEDSKLAILDQINFNAFYKIQNHLNALYLEEDFNGDGYVDWVLPIENLETKKHGFIIVHGETNEVHIVNADTELKENYICETTEWMLNREKVNEPTIYVEEGTLILDNPSIFFRTTCGCWLIYWDGVGYSDFYQCA